MDIRSISRKIKWRFGRNFYNEDKRLWQKVMFTNEDFKMNKIMPLEKYFKKGKKNADNNPKRVISIYDGKINGCGLADRIKGIISIYEICKKQNLEYKILFTHPFYLTDFLLPNKVNWHIQENEINYDLEATDICYIYSIAGTLKEADRQRKWFNKWFKSNKTEFHVRTNARTFDNKFFSSNFNELFTIAPRLQKSINEQRKILGNSYISTSFRFLNLLGDFNEPGISEVLTNEEKQEMIAKNIKQIKLLHNLYPDKRILVNSDSITFLQEARKLDYTYTIPGNITHIDSNNVSNDYHIYEKTFLDFFMIANADKIYLYKTGKMYKSGYPGIASLINNKPFKIIEF